MPSCLIDHCEHRFTSCTSLKTDHPRPQSTKGLSLQEMYILECLICLVQKAKIHLGDFAMASGKNYYSCVSLPRAQTYK